MKPKGIRIGRAPDSRSMLYLGIAIWVAFLAANVAPAVADLGREPVDSYEAPYLLVEDPGDYYSSIPESGVAIAYFKQRECPGCKIIEPHLMRYASDNRDVRLIVVSIDDMLRVSASRTLSLLQELGVPGTPTLIIYVDGVESARKLGIFSGDQYEGIRMLVDAAIRGKALSGGQIVSPIGIGLGSGQVTPSPSQKFEPSYIAANAGMALILGLVAAFSPCSLPVLVAYANTARGESGRLARVVAANTVTIILVVIGMGSLLALVYVASAFLPVNAYSIVITFLASMLISWGLLNLRGRNPVISLRRLRHFLPVMGLGCSMPFILAFLALIDVAPHIVVVSSIAFGVSYAAPYIGAFALGAGFMGNIEKVLNSRRLLAVQGLILVAAGLYVLYFSYGAII